MSREELDLEPIEKALAGDPRFKLAMPEVTIERLVYEVRRLREKLDQPFVMRDGVPEPLFQDKAVREATGMEEAAKVVEGMQRDDQDPDDNAQLRAIAAELRERASRK